METILLVLGVIIIAVLSVIAYRLQQKVKQVEMAKEAQRQEHEKKAKEKRDSMNKSIQILAQGLREDQVTKTEAAIRISVLLEFLGVDDSVKAEYSALFQLAEASAHIPILDKWKALSTKEKMRYDNERMALEEKYGDFVINAAERIKGQYF